MTQFKRLLIGSIVLGFNNASGQQPEVKTDTSDLSIISFPKDLKRKYSGSEFDYETQDTGGVNLFQKLIAKFFNWLGDMFGFDVSFINYKLLQYIIYGLLALICIYVITKLLLEHPLHKVFTAKESVVNGFSYGTEDIKTVNFDALIAQALQKKNYRLATRYLYLKCLKLMAKQAIIDWHYEKTNSDYLKEIKNDTLKEQFKTISYIYDYVWYGEFPITKANYMANRTTFYQILQTVKYG